MSRPQLSVIIPTFNRAELLRASLESLVRQTLSQDDYEVIVVNDGSTDKTPAVCAEMAARLPLKYFRIENSGISAAKNLGIFAASAPILFFFDDDDVATPNLLRAHLYAHSEHTDANVAILGYTTWHPSVAITEVMHYATDVGHLLFSYPNLRDGQELDFTYFWGGRSSCKRQFLVDHGVFHQDFRFGSEDVELGYRLSRFGLKVVYKPQAVQYMNRALTYEQFCRRCEKQGASQLHFFRLHPHPEIDRYCGVTTAKKCWPATASPMGTGFYRVRELEALLASTPESVRPASLVSELHRLYKWTFDAFKMKGIMQAERRENEVTSSCAVDASTPVVRPVIVYQMGKVGSKSIEQSLRSYDLDAPICHSHLLNHLVETEKNTRRTRAKPGQTLVELNHARQLRATVLGTPYIHCRLISVVRDPIARNISAFFQNINEYVPEFAATLSNGEVNVGDLCRAFIERFDHETPLAWFDNQMRPVFGIDVFASPFPKDRGFSIYKAQAASLLLFKLEHLQNCVQAAMKEFLGVERFVLQNANTSDQKEYKDVYREFLGAVQLPDDYIERFYGSQMVRHFYTDDEIAGFRSRWANRGPPLRVPA